MKSKIKNIIKFTTLASIGVGLTVGTILLHRNKSKFGDNINDLDDEIELAKEEIPMIIANGFMPITRVVVVKKDKDTN